MDPLDTIMITAHRIASSGKQPSLALIKRQLGTQYPMPVLIQGLQSYKAMSAQEKQALSQAILTFNDSHIKQETNIHNFETAVPTPEKTQAAILQLQQKVASLTEKLAVLTQEHSALKETVTHLKNNR
ncbi:hypothetical protein [uncultured Shewanella sp.]|uniref:hypothetical protein n=1 Tax=uncultured Shewanella sp. TaxID=173975 RepID=UPI002606B08F|nr:hypothetical protein [uncultured Shewanella sp.]